MIQHKPLFRLGRSGEPEWASLIADSVIHSCSPSSAQMNSDSGAIYNCRPPSPPSALPDFFLFFLCAGGTGGRLKGICDLIITPSPHLSDPAAFISLSAPLSPCHFPPLSLFTALFPHLSFIQSLSPRLLSVFRPSPRCSVGCSRPRCMSAERKMEDSVLLGKGRRAGGSGLYL